MRTLFALALLGGTATAADPKTYREDFEKAKVGEVPKGWTVAKTGTGEGSAWKVVEDKSAPKGEKVLAQVAVSPLALFNLCVADDTNFRDLEVSVAFKSVKGEDDQGGGVLWRYVDANNYYVARYNPREDNFRLYKIVAGKRSQLGNKDIKLAAGEWHTLTVRMKDDNIECLLDGKKQLEVKDDAFAKAGKVGLWTKADAHTYFDDFQAKEITK
jgi:hypothetical protein